MDALLSKHTLEMICLSMFQLLIATSLPDLIVGLAVLFLVQMLLR